MSNTEQLLLVAALAFPPLEFGLNTAILNAPMNYMGCEVNSEDCIPFWDPAIPNSVYAIGGLIGSLIVPIFMKKWKLGKVCLFYQTLFFMGFLGLWISRSMRQIIVSRTLSGIAAGGALVVSPIGINLVSPHKWKGVLGSVTQISANVGIIVAQLLGYIWAESSFRKVFYMAFLFSLVPTFMLYYVLLLRLRAPIEETYGLIAVENQKSASLREYLGNRKYRYSLITSLSVFALQQFTGINAIIVYGVSILSVIIRPLAGVINLALSVVNLVSTTVAAGYVDKFGRKKMLISSLWGMSICSFLMALGIVNQWQLLTVISSLLTVVSFAIGVGPIPFVLVGEVTSTEALDFAQSFGTAVSWISMFIVVGGFPKLQEGLGGWSFMVFSFFGIFGGIFYTCYLN